MILRYFFKDTKQQVHPWSGLEAIKTESVIAGEPFIEAAKHEKISNYPRIILAPSALKIMEQLYQQHF